MSREPGVYFFYDSKGTVIYVGKALNLHNRLRSYFRKESDDVKTNFLKKHINDFEIILTGSENEALILESILIKKHLPKYNVSLKDDKRYPYICLTTDEPFPRLFITRNLSRKNSKNAYYGPYTDVRYIRETLDDLHKIFKIRSCRLNLPKQKLARPCLEYDIGRCEAPCVEYINEEVYQSRVKALQKFLDGHVSQTMDSLRLEIQEHAQKLEFEIAAQKRDILRGIESLGKKQHVDLKSSDNSDVIGFAVENGEGSFILLRVRKGIMVERRPFFFKGKPEWPLADFWEAFWRDIYIHLEAAVIPEKIFVPVDMEINHTVQRILAERTKRTVSIEFVSGVSNDLIDENDVDFVADAPVEYQKNGQQFTGLLRLAQKNAVMELKEEISRKNFRDKRAALNDIKKHLGLSGLPRLIECFDVSTIQGKHTVASLVSFYDGQPYKKRYRRMQIRSVTDAPDDFAAMHEAVARYLSRLIAEDRTLPDLLLVDGGKGQLSAALSAMNDLGLSEHIPMASLAKRMEEIYLPGYEKPLTWQKSDKGLVLLRAVRDEAHRFAITYHRLLRNKQSLRSALKNQQLDKKNESGK